MIPTPLFQHVSADGTTTEVDRMDTGEIMLSVTGPDIGDRAHRIVMPAEAWEAMRGERLVPRVVRHVLIGEGVPAE